MQNGDVLQIKDFQTLTNIEGDILNVFYYQVAGLGSTVALGPKAAEFSNSWADIVTSALQVVQVSQLAHTRLDVNNLMSYDTDFFSYTYPSALVGNVSGGYSASSVAWSFQLVRTLRTTRHGSKRIAGVPESQVDNNIANSLIVPSLTTITGVFGGHLFIELAGYPDFELIPVILKSPVLTATPPTVINPVASCAYRGVGSQNTRKQLLS